MKKILFLLVSFWAQAASAQTAQSIPKLFLDCMFCDRDFIRTEITFVNYVTERTVADLHILVTSETAGGGGEVFTLDFIGQGRFEGQKQTVKYSTNATDSPDERRKKMVKYLKFGLVPFVAATAAAENLSVAYTKPETQTASTAQTSKDRWNLWSFRIGGSLNMDAESSYESRNYSTRISGTRTSERWKTELGLQNRVSQSIFKYTDTNGAEVKDETENNYRSAYGSAVYALGKQVSGQVASRLYASSYENVTQGFRASTGLEYSFTPYKESTRRQLKVQWTPNFQNIAYRDTTIYNKIKESVFQNEASLILYQQQPWGSASISLEGAHYLHDFSKNRLSLFGNIQWRVFKGFSVQWGGNVSFIRDQLGISAKGLKPSERFTRTQEQKTNFRYWTWLSLAYRFGSTQNNVVNSRFESGGGSFFFSD